MCAVAESAFLGVLEDFGEVAGEFSGFYVEGSEALDAWCVDEVSSFWEFEHLAEGCGVHSCLVCLADVCCPQVGLWEQCVDECALAYAAVSAEERCLAFQYGAQVVHALSFDGGQWQAFVSYALVEPCHVLLELSFLLAEDVCLVEDDGHGYSVCFCRCEEAVDEHGAGLRVADGGHQECLVDVCGDDVALLGEVGCLADDVVSPLLDAGDECGALWVEEYLDVVSHCHGVGAAYAFEPEVPLDLAGYVLPGCCAHDVPASCVLDDESLLLHFCGLVRVFPGLDTAAPPLGCPVSNPLPYFCSPRRS